MNENSQTENKTNPIPMPGDIPLLVSKEQLYDAMPSKMKTRITDEFTLLYNEAIQGIDSDLVYAFKENFLSYSNVLESSTYKIEDYLNAVKYVGFKLMGYTNRDSYKMTFPKRFDRLMEKYRDLGFDDKFIWDYKISPHVVSYNKNMLVNKISEQTMIPTHVLNQSLYQEALNTQAVLMQTAKSEMVRATAANSILTQLKPPEVSKVEIDVSVKESDAIKDLREITQSLSIAQQRAIESGATTSHSIAESKIVFDAEIEE